MFLFKKKINVSDLAKVLYLNTIDTDHFRNRIEASNGLKPSDMTMVLNEMILLRSVTVCYLISTDIIFNGYKKRIANLPKEYLGYFTTDERRNCNDFEFTKLLEERNNEYRPLLEKGCIDYSLDLAEIFAKNCQTEGSKDFVLLIKKCYLDSLLNYNVILRSYIII